LIREYVEQTQMQFQQINVCFLVQITSLHLPARVDSWT
jgi:hypothetical protein